MNRLTGRRKKSWKQGLALMAQVVSPRKFARNQQRHVAAEPLAGRIRVLNRLNKKLAVWALGQVTG
jgi:hypothetical protein